MKKKLCVAIFACLASALFIVGVFGSPIFNGISFKNHTDFAPTPESEPFSREKESWEDVDRSPPVGPFSSKKEAWDDVDRGR